MDGTLDRTALANLVFHDPIALRDLEAMTHPLIRMRIDQALELAPRTACRLRSWSHQAHRERGAGQAVRRDLAHRLLTRHPRERIIDRAWTGRTWTSDSSCRRASANERALGRTGHRHGRPHGTAQGHGGGGSRRGARGQVDILPLLSKRPKGQP